MYTHRRRGGGGVFLAEFLKGWGFFFLTQSFNFPTFFPIAYCNEEGEGGGRHFLLSSFFLNYVRSFFAS